MGSRPQEAHMCGERILEKQTRNYFIPVVAASLYGRPVQPWSATNAVLAAGHTRNTTRHEGVCLLVIGQTRTKPLQVAPQTAKVPKTSARHQARHGSCIVSTSALSDAYLQQAVRG